MTRLSLALRVVVSIFLLGASPVFAGYQFVDLSPVNYSPSSASGIANGQQGGNGRLGSSYHALMWSGSAASVKDLNPAGDSESYIEAISGGRQAGYGIPSGATNSHALLWSGTAASVVDLHPAGFVSSSAEGISGNEQVGAAYAADGFGH